MSDERPDAPSAGETAFEDPADTARDAEGPTVPADLVPEIEVPAVREPAPLWKSLTVAAVVVLALVAIGIGIWRANAVWGTHAMVVTGIQGAEALIQGDAATLASVSTPQVRGQITPQIAQQMKSGGALADFSEPVWSGDSAFISAMVGPNAGRLTLQPDGQNADAVDFATADALGKARGVLVMERDWSGWKIAGITVTPQQ